MEEAMLTHRSANRKARQPPSCPSQPASNTNQASWNQASLAQARSFAQFSEFDPSRRPASLPSESRSSSSTPAAPSARLPSVPNPVGLPRQPTRATPVPTEEEERERDIRAVRNALYRYREEPVIPEKGPLDLVRWWDEHEQVLPLLFPVALDILPVQASAVPCERTFSSSKETCALRRSLLSASTLEVLQVLKQLYKDEQLSFVTCLLAKEDDYAIDHATEAAIHELISAGNLRRIVGLA